MRFTLPGQLRGPECREVMKQATALRKTLEPLLENCTSENITDLAIVLRVDGSLGSFGSEGVENIELNEGKICCDLVIRDHGWKDRGPSEIRDILKKGVLDAVTECFAEIKEETDLSEIRRVLSNDS